jgi:GT2 family glycosyltransferase
MEILVVDNEGTAATRATFEVNSDLVDHFQQFNKNIGFTGACNFGLDYAHDRGFENVLWFNNDAEAGPNCITRLLEVIESDRSIAMVSPVLRDPETGRAHFCGARLDRSIPSMRYLNLEALTDAAPHLDCYLYGTALMARADAAKEVGGFCDKYFAYWEDMELSDKLLRAGFHCRVVPDASVFHTNQHSEEIETIRSKYYYYYMTRNELDFWCKALTGIARVRALYWYWCRTRSRIKKLSCQGHRTEAKALRDGLRDGILGRYGRWRLHPTKAD